VHFGRFGYVQIYGRDIYMSDTDNTDKDKEPIPGMQSLLDNTFLLLFIGVAVPSVIYTIWGVMEVANIPLAH
jgi:hypothetical protein